MKRLGNAQNGKLKHIHVYGMRISGTLVALGKIVDLQTKVRLVEIMAHVILVHAMNRRHKQK